MHVPLIKKERFKLWKKNKNHAKGVSTILKVKKIIKFNARAVEYQLSNNIAVLN